MPGCGCSWGRFGQLNQPELEGEVGEEGLISCYQHQEEFAALTTDNRHNLMTDKTL